MPRVTLDDYLREELKNSLFTEVERINFIKFVKKLAKNDFKTLKDVLDLYKHPSKQDFEDYINDPNNYLWKGIDFGKYDNIVFVVYRNKFSIDLNLQDFYNYLNLVFKYESENDCITHKGAPF